MNDLFAMIYEWLYYEPEFSSLMYTNGLYGLLGIFTILIPLIIVVLYYLTMNHPRLNRKKHWAIALVFNALLSFFTSFTLVTFLIASLNMEDSDTSYVIQSIEFSLVSILYAVILFVIFSLLIKPFSTNCSKTPF